jgi:ZIP family zinc transporter
VDLIVVILAGAATALATGLGAIPVFLLGERAEGLRSLLSAIAAAVMLVASITLLGPALDDGSALVVAAGVAAGGAFVLGARRRLAQRGRYAGSEHAAARRSLLVFGVLFVHSLPEGLAVGAAWAADPEAVGPFVVAAIALQNVPEGTAVAIPMAAAGYSRTRQFWAAVGSSAPQPVGAAIAYVLVEEARFLLPVSLAFAAGAMLVVVFAELVPDSWRLTLVRALRRPDAPGQGRGQV